MTGLLSVLEPTAITRAKRIGTIVGVVMIAAAIFGAVVFGLTKIWPRADQTPIIVARKDEQTAAHVATAIATDTQARTQDATVHIDLTTKEIHDAFSSLPAPRPAGDDPRPLPAAPVDRVRDRLNESIARANRAAGAAAAIE
ncbi:hypothetical protein [Sphingomonas sp. NFR15]|uniref:hypothetical protein n=1 Tax=Sphingomonas sp. NFR15 TaxID=1566282 RepID=UPI00088C23C9|nr:hypothetical protein [Sphingomonas sp. NFR15]SDA14855.1 hypothetical protein SAMN03159340_00604 [Sphingomonas sp. NFR15]